MSRWLEGRRRHRPAAGGRSEALATAVGRASGSEGLTLALVPGTYHSDFARPGYVPFWGSEVTIEGAGPQPSESSTVTDWIRRPGASIAM